MTMKSTELWHVQAVSNNIVSVHKQLTVSDTIVLAHKTTTRDDLPIVIFDQHQVQNDQTKQKTGKNSDQNFNKETSMIIPNFISPRSLHSPNGPHILYKKLIPGNTILLSHKNSHSYI